ncbi:MAG: HPr kinase/phosphatase C-terminal domain-containing protein [Hyphomicrobiales bacterium]|nr:HPr kinase/phosphatase C-terminal domain-containing protein [Hyphomicrobiales bacterium]
MIQIHGTCIALGEAAAVLTGPSGSGKSDLGLRFIHETPRELDPALIADDQVFVSQRNGRLIGRVPDTIAGRIEIRGVGIAPVPYRAEAQIRLFVELVDGKDVPRHPPEPLHARLIHDISVPVISLAPFEASAPLKLRYAILTVQSNFIL